MLVAIATSTPFFSANEQRQSPFGLRDLRRVHAAGQFDRFVVDLAVREQPFRLANPLSLLPYRVNRFALRPRSGGARRPVRAGC